MISLDDILVKHLILFDYDISDAIIFISPHFVFRIEDSIHYKCLINSNFSDYNSLLNTTMQSEHSIENYLELMKKFDINKLSTNKIKLEWVDEIKKYIILDGCHRLSIIKYNKLDNNGYLPIEYFDIKNDLKYE